MQGTGETNQALERIETAVMLRRGFRLSDTDSMRQVDGEGDGLRDLFVDDFAGNWLVSTMGNDEWPEGLEDSSAALGWKSLYWRRLKNDGKKAAEWMGGARLEDPFPCLENALHYLIDFGAGYSPGIFLDQRDNRSEVRRRVSAGERVLNTYAYTCGFSVAAAAGGATTTSLDLSARYLEWGKQNFALNKIAPEDHFFCKGDTLEWLKRFAKQGRSFHGIILDPPTFSRGPKGKTWRVERDFFKLVAAAAEVTESGGWILCCTNCRKLPVYEFEHAIFEGLGDAGRTGRLDSAPMPVDFRGEPYLQSIWVELA